MGEHHDPSEPVPHLASRALNPHPLGHQGQFSVTCENVHVKLQIGLVFFSALVATSVARSQAVATADISAGAVLFRDNCARCHGANLEGTGKAPALAEIRTKKHWTDERITNRILSGAGKKMPAFRGSLTEDQIRQLIAYLRAENRPPQPTAPEQK
jgi:mono/diheme cytochrome c family protein